MSATSAEKGVLAANAACPPISRCPPHFHAPTSRLVGLSVTFLDRSSQGKEVTGDSADMSRLFTLCVALVRFRPASNEAQLPRESQNKASILQGLNQ